MDSGLDPGPADPILDADDGAESIGPVCSGGRLLGPLCSAALECDPNEPRLECVYGLNRSRVSSNTSDPIASMADVYNSRRIRDSETMKSAKRRMRSSSVAAAASRWMNCSCLCSAARLKLSAAGDGDWRDGARFGDNGCGMPWSFSGVCSICDMGRGELSARRREIGGGVGRDLGGMFGLCPWYEFRDGYCAGENGGVGASVRVAEFSGLGVEPRDSGCWISAKRGVTWLSVRDEFGVFWL